MTGGNSIVLSGVFSISSSSQMGFTSQVQVKFTWNLKGYGFLNGICDSREFLNIFFSEKFGEHQNAKFWNMEQP
jgi:hypothetical protein